MTHYHVRFERIGRNHNVKPICREVKNVGELAREITKYAKQYLASSDVVVEVDLDKGTGWIGGGFRIFGRLTVEDAGHPAEVPA